MLGISANATLAHENTEEPLSDPSKQDTWFKPDPLNPPSRRYPEMAYDSQSDKVVIFGSWFGGSYIGETWAYDYNSNIWTNMNPPVAPSPRSSAAMAYDSLSDRIILFGGNKNPDDYYNDTWAYDYETNTWTNMNPPSSPVGRQHHQMVYDSQSDRIVLFGGLWGGDETWAYDYDSNTWTNMNPSTSPIGRVGHAMAYDSESDRVIFFGGSPYRGGTEMNDTWAYDLETNTWTNMNPPLAPGVRDRHEMVYVSDNDMVLLFSGCKHSGLIIDYDDTWGYDYNTNTWTNLNPPTTAGHSRDFGMAYDSESDVVVLFDRETWIYGQPYAQVVKVNVDCNPNTLNLKSRGRFFTCFIELPAGYNIQDIDISTILLEDSIPIERKPRARGDYDRDGIFDLMVKFDRSELKAILSSGTYNFKLTGELTDGTPLSGESDDIRVINPPYSKPRDHIKPKPFKGVNPPTEKVAIKHDISARKTIGILTYQESNQYIFK